MHDFILTLLFNIHGIGAASGLLHHDGRILLISDNSNCLYTYDIASARLGKKQLEPFGISENIPKKDKPDYEAMSVADGKLYLFGSGSTPKRNFMAATSFPDLMKTSIFDLSKLYEKMRGVSKMSTADFNIEGATSQNRKWYFFQRGNGPGKRNGVFTVTGKLTGNDFSVDYRDVVLPDCNGMPATFTDAVSVNDKIYFVATAENSNSVYDDGEILGSVIGRLDPETMEIEFTMKISNGQKFEGLTLYASNNSEIAFLLCEDSDSETTESGIYKLVLPK